MRNKLWLILAALTMFGACATRGKDFPSETNWIKTNSTRQSDVSQLLGEPYQVGNAGGVSTWTYGYYKFRLIGESNTKELKFWWNPDKTVKYFSFSSSFPMDKGKGVAPRTTPAPAATPPSAAGEQGPPSYQEYPTN